MLNRLFGRVLPTKKTIKRKGVLCGELSNILRGEAIAGRFEDIIKKSIKDSEFEDYIDFPDELGREGFCIIKNLDIMIGSENGDVLAWGSDHCLFNLRFENCHFVEDKKKVKELSKMGSGVSFAVEFVCKYHDKYSGKRLHFEKNESELGCNFSFPTGSHVVFIQNNFKSIVVKGDGIHERGVSFEFIRNEFGYLHLDAPRPNDEPFKYPNNQPILYPIDCRFIGKNKIRRLELSNVADRNGLNVELDVNWYRNTAVFVGHNEKIEWEDSDDPYPARDLFRKLKHIAHARSDTGQEVVLSNCISRIEYQIMRRERRGKWYKNWEWYSNWAGRLLMWWRWRLSDFYTSWIRPFGCLIGGYLAFNAIPFLGIDSDFWYKVHGWLAFSFFSPVKIPFYAEGLKAVIDAKELKLGEGWLHFIGFLRLLWIALWGYAFRNAIKTFSSR